MGGGGVEATMGGGADSGGAIAHPAMIKVAAAGRAWRAARERRGLTMEWFFLEALTALLIAVAIVWWTMGPKRGKPKQAAKDASDDAGTEPR